MPSPLRLQIPARIPPHAVWHAYSLRLKASEKHQISRHNTEKTSTMLQGRMEEMGEMGLCPVLRGETGILFFQNRLLPKQIRQARAK